MCDSKNAIFSHRESTTAVRIFAVFTMPHVNNQ